MISKLIFSNASLWIPYPTHVNRAIALLIELILLVSARASLCASCGRFILESTAVLGGPERRTRGTKALPPYTGHKRSSMLAARTWEKFISTVTIKLIVQIVHLMYPNKEESTIRARLWSMIFIKFCNFVYISYVNDISHGEWGFFDLVTKMCWLFSWNMYRETYSLARHPAGLSWLMRRFRHA